MAQKVRARSTCSTGCSTMAGATLRVRRGAPDERQAHQRIDMERALVDEAEIALQLAVIGGEDHIGVARPSRARRSCAITRPTASSISSFITWTLALISRMLSARELLRREVHRPAFDVRERAVVIGEPMRRLAREDLRGSSPACRDSRRAAAGRASRSARSRTPAGPRDDADRGSSATGTSRRRRRVPSSQSSARPASQSV